MAARPDTKLGPAMAKLTVMQRNFVLAIMAQGDRNATRAAEAAGYSADNQNALRASASRLWHDEDIQAAIYEETVKRLKGLLPAAVQTIGDILENPQEAGATRLKAATTIMDRAGIHAVTEHVNTEVQIGSDPDRLKRIVSMANRLGLPLDKLLGARLAALAPPVTDTEFVEVSTEGLEGLI